MMTENNKKEKCSSDAIIEAFLNENNLSLLDLEHYLSVRGVVCVIQEDYDNLQDTE